jgi:hypothetical protein
MGRAACTEPQCLYIEYRIFPGSKEWPGRDADPTPSSSAVGHERVELYLYSPYGPYGSVQSLNACTRVCFTFYHSDKRAKSGNRPESSDFPKAGWIG